MRLQGDVLGDGLDDELGVAESAEVCREVDAGERVVSFRFGCLAVVDGARERRGDARACRFQRLVVDLPDDYGQPGGRADLRDAGAHQPATQDGDALDRHQKTGLSV